MAGRLKGKEGHHGRRGKKGVVAEIRHQACTSIVFLRERAHHAQSVHRMFGRCASRDMPERERERERKGGWLKGGNAWCIALYARVTRRIFLLSIFLTRRGRRVDRDGKMEGGRNKGWVNASMTKWRLAGLIGGREKLPRPGGRESRYVARFNAWSGGFDAGERGRNTDGWKLTTDKFVLKFSYLSSEIFLSFD